VGTTYPHQRLKPLTFRPPRNNRAVISVAGKLLLPLALRFHIKVSSVEIQQEDLARLKQLKQERVVLLPNHSEEYEPYILFHLSKLLGMEFNYLTAQELFEKGRVQGWFLQGAGAYSIVRGTADRASFRMTRQLLVEGKRWLVAFPEGVAVGLGDLLMPFQSGIAQLGFWACEDLTKVMHDLPAIYFVPVALKYLYTRDMRGEIEESLGRLEQKLLNDPDSRAMTPMDRLLRIGDAVLSANEKTRGVRPQPGISFNERVQYLKELIIARVAAALGISLRTEQPLMDRIRTVQNSIDQILYAEPSGTDYEQQLLVRRQEEVRELADNVLQVRGFAAFDTAYVEGGVTAERFLDVLRLLELEIFGKQRFWGPRKVVLRVGEPLDLQAYVKRYRADREGGLEEVTRIMEDAVRGMLTELSGLSQPFLG